MNLLVAWKMNAYIIYVYISKVMNLFVVKDEYTYYFRLYILGHDPFCCGRRIHILFMFVYLRL